MLTVISPAKKLNAERRLETVETTPVFKEQTQALLEIMQQKSVGDLQALMHISENLGQLNHDRFQSFTTQPEAPALFMFDGDTYAGLDALTLSDDALRYAQENLRILSGLYGLLRPLDAARPYRLEMGVKLATEKGKTLYQFWGVQIAEMLNAQAEEASARYLLNCASQEYFGAVDLKALTLPVITPVFLEEKPGGPKIVSFYAKRARGALARFVIEERITDPEDLKAWDAGGYVFDPDRSTPEKPVFYRSAAALAAA